MLQDKDRIFINLYGDSGRDIKSAKARGDWKDTKGYHQLPEHKYAHWIEI